MRCNPLTVTGPVPAFSLMVTGAFSSNSPRLTWGGEGRSWDISPIIYAWHINLHVERLHCTVPWADSSCGGGRWALRWSFPGGSWPSPPPRYSPPWRPPPGKPEETKAVDSGILTVTFLDAWYTSPVATVHTVLSSRKCSRSSSSSPWKV